MGRANTFWPLGMGKKVATGLLWFVLIIHFIA
jgi:hypothetical protein